MMPLEDGHKAALPAAPVAACTTLDPIGNVPIAARMTLTTLVLKA